MSATPDFVVRSRRAYALEVSEAPPMPGLPPVTGTITVTVDEVEDPGLEPAPPTAPAPPPDAETLARIAEENARYLGSELLFVSASIFEGRTFLRVRTLNSDEPEIAVLSNLDFHHFGGFGSFRKEEADGTYRDYALLMAHGQVDRESFETFTAHADSSPPPLAEGGPAFTIIDDDADPGSADIPVPGATGPTALEAVRLLHDHYAEHGAEMKAAHEARVRDEAARRAGYLANPPQPEDVTIRFWRGTR